MRISEAAGGGSEGISLCGSRGSAGGSGGIYRNWKVSRGSLRGEDFSECMGFKRNCIADFCMCNSCSAVPDEKRF